MKRGILLAVVLCVLLACLCSGCGTSEEAPLTYTEPPAPVEELRGACRPGWVWVPGHWAWRAQRGVYVWTSGKCIKRKAGKIWVTGHWRRHGQGWIWIEGHWK